jgi:hypothetical protein
MDVDVPADLKARLLGSPAAAGETVAPVADAVAVGLVEGDAADDAVADEEVAEVPEVEAPIFSAPRPLAPALAARGSSRVRPSAQSTEERFFRPYEDEEEAPAQFYREPARLTDQGRVWLDSLRAAPFWALGGVMTVVAIYLALAIGDSIKGGGGNAGAVPLQSTASAGASQTGEIIECGSSPIALDHGTESIVSFDSRALSGFTIGGLAVVPNSQAATPDGLRATAEGTQGIKFQAAKAQSTTNRTDQYLLRISWRKGNDVATSECPVTVRISPAAP